jgi:hypothetical protein
MMITQSEEQLILSALLYLNQNQFDPEEFAQYIYTYCFDHHLLILNKELKEFVAILEAMDSGEEFYLEKKEIRRTLLKFLQKEDS